MSNWDVSKVDTMEYMLNGASSFNQPPWCTESWFKSTFPQRGYEDTISAGIFCCRKGEYFHNGKCQQCQPGRFQSEDYNQVATCKTCARDSVSAFGAESCVDCSPDQFSNNKIDCVTCPSGYFQVDDAQISACLKCPIGKHQPARGTSFCIACNIGQYQDARGKQYCLP